jgi:hypothetical protein
VVTVTVVVVDELVGAISVGDTGIRLDGVVGKSVSDDVVSTRLGVEPTDSMVAVVAGEASLSPEGPQLYSKLSDTNAAPTKTGSQRGPLVSPYGWYESLISAG